MADLVKEYREALIEKVSEVDDTILERYLHGQPIPEADIKKALPRGPWSRAEREDRFRAGDCGSAFKNKGVQPLLDAVVDYLPSPVEIPPVTGLDPKAPRAPPSIGPRPTMRRCRRSRSRS